MKKHLCGAYLSLAVFQAFSVACATPATARAASPTSAKNIVIVHGAFADGSGWEGVYRILTKDGYKVTIVQNPLLSLDADVTAMQNALANQSGPTVLVGHSYGGAVITQAGNDPKVKSLVYVAAYLPDVGQSVGDLLADADPTFPAPPILIDPQKGIALLDRAKFTDAFAADIDREQAEFMAASQAPLGLQAVGTKLTRAAWKTKPTFAIITTEDHMISPADQRRMIRPANASQTEIKASHAVYISHPDQVAAVIEKAASE